MAKLLVAREGGPDAGKDGGLAGGGVALQGQGRAPRILHLVLDMREQRSRRAQIIAYTKCW